MDIKKELSFYWIAEFDDGSIIKQFTEDGEEVLYKEVLDNYNNLAYFSITDDVDTYTVDLVKWKLFTPDKIYKSKGANPKLIYFRRNQVRMNMGPVQEILPPRVYHHIGIDTDGEDIEMEVFAGQGMKLKSKDFIKKKK